MTVVDPAYVLKLLQIASTLSGYSITSTPPPQVLELTSQEMHDVVCLHKVNTQDDCSGFAGLYLDGDTIWIDGEWTNSKEARDQLTSEASYIVHELTHFLQNQHSWGGINCPHIAARESEAYRVQRKYIQQYEQLNAHIIMPEVCGIRQL